MSTKKAKVHTRKPIEPPTLREVLETVRAVQGELENLASTVARDAAIAEEQQAEYTATVESHYAAILKLLSAELTRRDETLKANQVAVSKMADELAAATEQTEKLYDSNVWLFKQLAEQTVVFKELAAQMRLNTAAVLQQSEPRLWRIRPKVRLPDMQGQ
jgi:hypothetical protein